MLVLTCLMYAGKNTVCKRKKSPMTFEPYTQQSQYIGPILSEKDTRVSTVHTYCTVTKTSPQSEGVPQLCHCNSPHPIN